MQIIRSSKHTSTHDFGVVVVVGVVVDGGTVVQGPFSWSLFTLLISYDSYDQYDMGVNISFVNISFIDGNLSIFTPVNTWNWSVTFLWVDVNVAIVPF